jgi:hypothetical protein
VHLSNEAYLDLTEGSGGVAGAYDRGMLERDLTMSAMTPGDRPPRPPRASGGLDAAAGRA